MSGGLAGVIHAASGARPAAVPSPPVTPPVAHTGSPGLNCVIDVVNKTAAPFQALASPEEGKAEAVADVIGGVLGVVAMPEQLLDTGFAVLTAPLAKMMPALPAVTILGMHVGPPHGHLHPPSFTPPATPSPLPLPSLGVLLGAGSFSVLLGGLPAARAGDIGIAAACGSFCPPFEVHTGSSSVFLGGSRAARMGDITRHCNPVAMAGLGLAMAALGAAGGIAGAIASGSPTAAAQAAADVAVLALKQLVGKDLAVPPAYGSLIGPPVGNVLIGGFPCPPLMDALKGLLKKLKAMAKKKGKASKEENHPCGTAAHPVNLVTGGCFDNYTEFVSGGLFEWRRYYSSDLSRQDGPLGHGQRHSYQYTLRIRLHRAVLTKWDGEQIEFPRFERGSNVTKSKGYVLTRVDRQTYRVSHLEDPVLEFVGDRFAGELQLVRTRNKDAELVISRDRVGRIEAFTETNFKSQTQRRFELRYLDTGRIQQLLEIPLGPYASQPVVLRYYQYTASGDLTHSVHHTNYPHCFEYDAAHRLTKDISQLGFTFTYRYDSRGRVVETAGQDGLWWAKFEYPKPGVTVFTEGEGARYEVHYDSDGAVTAMIDPYGGKLTRIRDENGRVVAEIDATGRSMRRLYDEDGAHYARMDAYGHLLPTASQAPIVPDPFVRTLPTQPIAWLLGEFLPPSHEADVTLWPISWNGPDPRFFEHIPPELAYLARAMFSWREGPRSPARPPQVERDARGKVVLETDERGATRRFRYDVAGNLIAEKDRDGRVQHLSVASWDQLGSRSNEVGQHIEFKYSKLADIVEITDPFGLVSRYDYDLKQRLLRVHRHGRIREEYVYDGVGHFIEKRDGDGVTLFRNEPHENHLVKKRTLASGGFHSFDYDSRGRVTRACTETSDVKLRYADMGPRRTSWPSSDLRDGRGIEHRRKPGVESSLIFGRFPQRRERYRHETALFDSVDQKTTLAFRQGLVQRRCPSGASELLQFDPEGRLLARVVYRPHRPQREAQSSRSGQPALNAWGTRYHYTLEGDLVRVDDSVRGTTHFEVDAAHRITAEITPQQQRLEYTHDAADNIVAKPGLPGLRLQPGNRLAASYDEAFEHDLRDHLARRKQQGGGEVRYVYDSFDMLIAVERLAADGTTSRWQASYDALARRIKSEHDGKAREFYWDHDRLAAELQPNGALRIYQYASGTALVPVAFPDYDGPEADPASGRSYAVFSDPVGMPLCIEDQNGNVVWWATRVDPYGAIEVAPGATLQYNLRWPGHYFDPETGLHYNRRRYYDPALGRYLQSDPTGYGGSPINLYAYCTNPLVHVDLLGLSDDCKNKHGQDEAEDRDGQEQTKPPPKLKGVTDDERALAAAPGDTPAQRDARVKIVRAFLEQHGQEWDSASGTYKTPTKKQIEDQVPCHDPSKPVIVGPPPEGPATQYQFQRKNGNQGSYYGDKDAKPTELGIAGINRGPDGRFVGKEQKTYNVDQTAPYLESTSAPATDTWSVKGMPVDTKGGATQRVIPDRSAAKAQ